MRPLRTLLAATAGLALLAPTAALADSFDGDPTTTERVDESDPTSAAISISMSNFADDEAVSVALSRDDLFADSLAAAGLALGPMLFTDTDDLTDATKTEIERVLPDGGLVYVLGGTQAVSQPVEDELEAAGYVVERLQGPSRVETAVAVANEIRGHNPEGDTAILARAYGTGGSDDSAAWADSVTGGGWAASESFPILLTPTEEMHPATAAWLSNDQPARTILLGGTAALSVEVEMAAPNPDRVSGGAREDTAAAIARELWGAPVTGDRSFVIIDGYRPDGWAYGLASASLAAYNGAPILVAHPDLIPAATLELVAACDAPEVDLVLVGDASIIATDRESTLDAVDGFPCSSNPLSGTEEINGSGDQDGTGNALLQLIGSQGIVCTLWDDIANITLPATAAHIHTGAAGSNGDVFIALDHPLTAGPERGCVIGVDRTKIEMVEMNPPDFYINVHTTDYPDGAIRGQVNSVGG